VSDGSIFRRILCGVDGTPASLAAVGQSVLLEEEAGNLRVIAAADTAKGAHAGFAGSHAAELMEQDAEKALAEARAIAPLATHELVIGNPIAILLRAAEQATLVAVGSHGRGRTAALLLGTVAARLLRDSPGSILIARSADNLEDWPRSVVVGLDGSAESAAAYAVARALADRFGASLDAVGSTGEQFDREAAEAIAPDLREEPGSALEVLTAASDAADVVVVGSRGLHGLKALGSVSERLAHRARSSVLVVRPAQP
jgi:nucleotide-binding universal stress UspA family protein